MAVKLQKGLIFKGCWLHPSAERAGVLPEGWVCRRKVQVLPPMKDAGGT